MSDDADYHVQRAEREFRLAEQAVTLGARAAHRRLAELHEARMMDCGVAEVLPLIKRFA